MLVDSVNVVVALKSCSRNSWGKDEASLAVRNVSLVITSVVFEISWGVASELLRSGYLLINSSRITFSCASCANK